MTALVTLGMEMMHESTSILGFENPLKVLYCQVTGHLSFQSENRCLWLGEKQVRFCGGRSQRWLLMLQGLFLLSDHWVLIKICCGRKFSPLTSISCLPIVALVVICVQRICTEKGFQCSSQLGNISRIYINIAVKCNLIIFFSVLTLLDGQCLALGTTSVMYFKCLLWFFSFKTSFIPLRENFYHDCLY